MINVFAFVVIIAIIATIYRTSKEKKNIAKQTAQKELDSAEKKAAALVPQIVSSDLYKEIFSFIDSEISYKEQQIRHAVDFDYNNFTRWNPNSSHSFVPNVNHLMRFDCLDIRSNGIYSFSADHDYPPDIDFSSRGYADLTNIQLYALIQALLQDFKCLESRPPISDLASDFSKGFAVSADLFLMESHQKQVIDIEIQHLQSQKSPYKSAF